MDLRVIRPSVCDVRLHSCWVSVGAREPNSHYHFFVQARPAIIMITMVIRTRPAAIMRMVMIIRFRSAGFLLFIMISQDRCILIFLNDS